MQEGRATGHVISGARINADGFALVLLHRLQGRLQRLARHIVVARKRSLDARANLLCEINPFAIIAKLQLATSAATTGIFIDIAIKGLPSSSDIFPLRIWSLLHSCICWRVILVKSACLAPCASDLDVAAVAALNAAENDADLVRAAVDDCAL
jgi:hypothetical protein